MESNPPNRRTHWLLWTISAAQMRRLGAAILAKTVSSVPTLRPDGVDIEAFEPGGVTRRAGRAMVGHVPKVAARRCVNTPGPAPSRSTLDAPLIVSQHRV
jgi:hypothetical protein